MVSAGRTATVTSMPHPTLHATAWNYCRKINLMKSWLERVLLAELLKGSGPERFELSTGGRAALVRALEKDLAGPAPLTGVQAALRFAAAFDGELASPSVAVVLRELLRAEPRAVALIRASRAKATPSPVSKTREFLRAEGRTTHVRAPSLSDRAPPSTVPLRTMIDPGRTQLAPGSAKRSLRG